MQHNHLNAPLRPNAFGFWLPGFFLPLYGFLSLCCIGAGPWWLASSSLSSLCCCWKKLYIFQLLAPPPILFSGCCTGNDETLCRMVYMIHILEQPSQEVRPPFEQPTLVQISTLDSAVPDCGWLLSEPYCRICCSQLGEGLALSSTSPIPTLTLCFIFLLGMLWRLWRSVGADVGCRLLAASIF